MAKTAIKVVFLYVLFALLSTIINISSQIVSIWVYAGTFAVEISILVGTVAGMPLRYFLEKRYIFAFKSKTLVRLLASACSHVTMNRKRSYF